MKLKSFSKLSSMLVVAMLVAGCVTTADKIVIPATVAEIHPGILQGYLPSSAYPDSLALLPPPPADGSAAVALDNEVSQASLALRGTPRWQMATQDANLEFPAAAGTFSCALGVEITQEQTPHAYMLLRRSLADVGLSSYGAKKKYQRARPFMANKQPTCTPEDEDKLRVDGSYPSGHTAIGWGWALILTEVSPQQTDAILARGRAFGQSRVVCNAHWQSDVNEGRIIGAAAVARLHSDPVFSAEVESARDELSALRDTGLTLKRDCKAEFDALNYP